MDQIILPPVQRGMTRRLLNLLTAVSLVLCLALASAIEYRATDSPPPIYSLDTVFGHFGPYFRPVGLVVNVAGLLFGILPTARGAAYVRGVVRARRRCLRGRCAACGYDLRATPEKCPECGASCATGATAS